MNKIPLNIVGLDGGVIIKKGGGGGVTIKNQDKSLEIVENGTTEVTADAGFTGLGKVTIDVNVPTGGGGVPASKPVNDVNFYDYDGTILHSYTKDEFLALSAMPPLPEREGLICQEWNWELSEAQEYVTEYGLCDIAATYITDDGKTRLYIYIPKDDTVSLPLLLVNPNKQNGILVDWGDGSPIQGVGSGSTQPELSHTYSKRGEYIITLWSENVTYGLGWGSASGYSIFGKYSTSGAYIYSFLKRVHVGANCAIQSYAFAKCSCLESATIPKDAEIGGEEFSECYNLRFLAIPRGYGITVNTSGYITRDWTKCYALQRVSLPHGVKGLSQCFQYCYSLNSIVVPESVKSFAYGTFNYCYSLMHVVAPPSLTHIGELAFQYCTSLKVLDCSRCMQVPDLAGKTFNNAGAVKVVVPDTLYDEWRAATNWSTYASRIIKKSDWDASQS